MDPDADLASVAALMADQNRAQMLLTLLGGVPQSGSALAAAAGISRSLASAHLRKLVAGGLVAAKANGRQQLYSIASEPAADALEILILLAPGRKVSSLRDATRAKSLRWARMCYDHLAGAVGVSVTEALLGRDLLRERDGGYALGPRATAEFGRFGIELDQLDQRTRPLAGTGASAVSTSPAAWARR
jgi:DNA-binding transcriptional ArsR family regulator